MLNNRFRVVIFATQALVLCCLVAPLDDPFEEYLQRKDSVAFGAGDAKERNSAIHIINPWPWYARNTRIPGDGDRMSGAIQRYHDVSKLPNAPRPIKSEYERAINIQSGGGQ